MSSAYRLPDLRLVAEAYVTSAVAGLSASTTAVPAGQLRTILAASYWPDMSETKVVHWRKYTRAGNYLSLSVPQSIALASTLRFPLLTEGQELMLLPGEALLIYRDSATAGSIMYLEYQFIDVDLPLYEYVEPQEQQRINKFRRGMIAGPVSPQGGGRPSSLGGVGFGGGRGGVPKPK